MGLYNRVHLDAPCRNCEQQVKRVVQIKFGMCQIYDYRLGDAVSWASGKRQKLLNHGRPTTGRAWVPAYAEAACPSCNCDSTYAEFAVVVEGDTIVATVQAPVDFCFAEEQDVVELPATEFPEPIRYR